MADYNGTDEDDIIDASELDSDIGNIYPGEGNDTVTNATSKHTIVTGPGEDTISGTKTSYALWNANQGVTINLKEGWSEDGFGTRDNVSGIETIHGTPFGDTFYGTENYEKFFVNGGDNILNMGGGDDRVSYASGNSKDYTVTLVGDEIHVTGPTTKDIIIGGRYVEFMADNKIIDTDYFKQPITSTFIKTVYSFDDETTVPTYIYSGETLGGGFVSWFPQSAALLDLNNDSIEDLIIPMNKGYGSGTDTSTPFIALSSGNGTLSYDDDINLIMPTTTGARRTEKIKLASTDLTAIVTAAHDTDLETNRNNPDSIVPEAELLIILPKGSSIQQSDIISTLPDANDDSPYDVDAHAMAVGDINGDGLDDIFVGHGWDTNQGQQGYALIQQTDGSFAVDKSSFYSEIVNYNSHMLLDVALVDVNNDGYDDIIGGYDGDVTSPIFLNDNGTFSKNNIITLPDSYYGSGNQMHMKTMPADFDQDGDIDLAILWTTANPVYAGNYIQINLNDGQGNYTDVTNLIPGNAFQDAYQPKLTWVEPWQMIDVNFDGHIDIAGSRSDVNGNYTVDPVVYFNDGSGRFEIGQIGSPTSVKGKPYAWGDFDQDQKIEYITFTAEPNASFTSQKISFYLFEIDNKIGTGPNFSNTTADQGAPGFNERYYLNENATAREALTAGAYDNGLAHYLSEGKDSELKTFAPFTKVYGYSGSETIVLREGDETAYGYAGNDTIEGGAGNDVIDGGKGVDTAIYKDSSSAYTLTANDDGTVSVLHSSPSENFIDEGTDTLTSIEKMQFSDKTLSKTSLKYQLSETLDSLQNSLSAHTEDLLSGTLNFNKGDNIIILDGQGKTYRGLEGDDTYFISQLLPKSGKVSITDTEGSNLVQLPANTYIDKSLFTKNAARLTLEDGREITISGADKFSYNVGGNITDGTKGTDLTFTEFAEVFGVYDILNSSGAQTGEISDMYII